MKSSLLSAAAVSALVAAAPARAATIIVTNQSQFDAAILTATQPGHTDTINATNAGPLDAGTSLTLPGAATSTNLEFGQFGIGDTVGDGSVTLGAGAILSFGQPGNAGALNMGTGHTGILNIDGGSLTFDVFDANSQFNIGLDGGNGIVNMTSGTVTIDTSQASLGNFGSIAIAFPFTDTPSRGTFNQSGGTVSLTAAVLDIGIEFGNGTYNLTNNAVLRLLQGGTVYIGASPQGVGFLNVSGNATFDLESFGNGGQMYVGDATGNGTITQNGAGSTVILNVVNIAQFGSNASDQGGVPGGTGTYNLLAGTLKIGGLGAAFGTDPEGVGFLNQSGGSLIASAPVVIGSSGTGTYNLRGGVASFGAGLTLAALPGSVGTVNQTGGVLTIAGGDLDIGVGRPATYKLSAGTLQVGGVDGIVGSGDLHLSGGTLQVIGSALTTSIAIGLTGTGSTIDTNGLGATLGGLISGGGGLVKSGLGTLSLTNANTYSGGTILRAGTLAVSADANLGAAAGILTFDGGTLQVMGTAFDATARAIVLGANGGSVDIADAANTFAASHSITGSGPLTKLGPGILALSGENAYAGPTLVSAGTLLAGSAGGLSPSSPFTVDATLDLGGFDETIGSLAGSGTIANTGSLAPRILTAGGDNRSTLFSGAFTGAVGLMKTGAGTMMLTGTSTNTGPTTVDGGILSVNGSIAASVVTVNAGGTLGGNGTVGGIVGQAGGTIAPGNSIGILHVAGDLTTQPGSIYQVQLDATTSDRLVVSGHAQLNGGTVQAEGTPTVGYAYTILTAGSVAGTFDGATGLAASYFMQPVLTYTANSVLLTEEQTRSFASAATTRNQAAVAGALAGLPATNRLFAAIVSQPTAAAARQAFDALSGEVHASAVSAAFDDSSLPRQAILDRLDGPYGAVQPSGMAAYSASAAPVAPSVAQSGLAFWGQGFGSVGRLGGDGNAASLDRSLAGFILGADASPDPRYRIGAAAGYTDSWLSLDPRGSSGSIESVFAGLYGGAALGAVRLRGGALYAHDQYDTDRTIAFSGFFDAAKAGYGGGTAQAFGEAGYHMDFGRYSLEPFAGALAMTIHTDGFTESGGPAALVGASRSYGFGATTLGVKGEMPLFAALPLVLKGTLGWRHVFGDVTPDARLAFAGTPATPFTIAGAPIARDSAVAEAGLDWKVTANTTAGLSYAGEIASKTHDNAVRGKLEVAF